MWFVVTVGSALAGTCDVKALKAELNAASPVAAPDLYVAIASCDPVAAKAVAKLALSKTLDGEKAWNAVLAALRVGAEAEVLTWINALEPDLRSRSADWLGARCATEPTVQTFFSGAEKSMGDAFWKDRWYRGLSECRVPAVTTLLASGLSNPITGSGARDRGQFFGLVETYARNAQAGAIPELVRLIATIRDPKEVRLLVSAFADAAGVGGASDPNAAAAAKKALIELGPTLPPEATQAARDTLRALGDEAAANSFVSYRWPDRVADGAYAWAVSSVETWTCKNGKKGATLHTGLVLEPLSRWPDAVATAVDAGISQQWAMDSGAKCKGEGNVVTSISEEPVTDGGTATFADAQTAFKPIAAGVEKPEVRLEAPWKLSAI